jgi:hypothetical protein
MRPVGITAFTEKLDVPLDEGGFFWVFDERGVNIVYECPQNPESTQLILGPADQERS